MRKVNAILSVLFMLNACLCATPEGGIIELEPFVATASLIEANSTSNSYGVKILSPEYINQSGTSDLADLLNQASGLQMEGSGGTVQRPSIRGVGTSGTLILVDGKRQAKGFRSNTDTFQIPLSMVERVEIIKGPASSIFGSDAMGGVVNVVTKHIPNGKTMRLNTRAGFGESRFYEGSSVGTLRKDNLSLMLATDVHKEKSWSNDDGYSDFVDDLDRRKIYGKAQYETRQSGVLTFASQYTTMDRDGKRNGKFKQWRNERYGTSLAYDHIIFEDTQLHVESLYDKFNGGMLPSDEEEYHLYGFKAYTHSPIDEKSELLLGIENNFENREKTDTEEAFDFNNKAVFSKIDYRLNESLILNFGIRQDWHSEFSNRITPRAGAVYHLNDFWRLKMSYSEGYRAPSPYELKVGYYQNKQKEYYQNNPSLTPEKSQNYEIIFEGEKDKAYGSICLYYIEIKDKIGSEFIQNAPDPAQGGKMINFYKVTNLSKVKNKGFEVESGYELNKNISLELGVSYLDTLDENTNAALPLEQKWKYSGRFLFNAPERSLNGNINFNYHDATKDGSGADIPSYMHLNAKVAKRISEQYEVYCGINNILDDTSEVHLNRTRPRTYYVGLEVGF